MRNIVHPMQRRYGERYIEAPRSGIMRIFGHPFYIVTASSSAATSRLYGGGYVYVYADELTTYPESFTLLLLSRLSEHGAVLDATCNADHPMHVVKRQIIDHASELDANIWQFRLDDNPFLDAQFIARLKHLYTGVWYKRYIDGEWAAGEGAIYDMLDPEVHYTDVVPPIRAAYIGIDYGAASVTTFVLVGLGTDARLYMLDVWYYDATEQRRLTDIDIARELERFIRRNNHMIDAIVIPSDAVSLGELLHNIRRGLSLVRHIAWADNSAGSVLRGIQYISMLLANHKLLFCPPVYRNERVMREWYSYAWKPNSTQDEPLKADDHSCDAARYAIMHAFAEWQHLLAGDETWQLIFARS
jgi:PBSX family phage terminase large subunit